MSRRRHRSSSGSLVRHKRLHNPPVRSINEGETYEEPTARNVLRSIKQTAQRRK